MKGRVALWVISALIFSTGCVVTSQDTTRTPPPDAGSPPDQASTRMPLDDPLLPPFTPSYPCELQNDLATISDETYCRSEQLTEGLAAEGDGMVFIHQTHHLGYGCWTGINSYQYALFTCDTRTGERTLLTDKPTTPLIPSPDGEWLAFSVTDLMLFESYVYKIRVEGSDMQRLDTQAFPEWTVSVNVLSWSADGDWIELSLWDGTEDGWRPYRLKADGSGAYESLP